jgi:hypothetical protein
MSSYIRFIYSIGLRRTYARYPIDSRINANIKKIPPPFPLFQRGKRCVNGEPLRDDRPILNLIIAKISNVDRHASHGSARDDSFFYSLSYMFAEFGPTQWGFTRH